MSRVRVTIAAVTCLAALTAAASAYAASQTVKGQGDIKKMTASNGSSAVTTKLVGLKGPCKAKQFHTELQWGSKSAYRAHAECTAGTTWSKGLEYVADRSDFSTNPKPVRCRGLKITFSGGVWTTVVPRSCISKAPARIRVLAEGNNYGGSAIPGMAGPTRLLSKG